MVYLWAIGGLNYGGSLAFGYTGGVSSGDYIALNLTVGPSSVPDSASTLTLMGLGLGLLAMIKRKQRA